MATNFPTSLDAFTNPTAVDTLDSPPHDAQHADANDAIEALEAKVGVDGSAVTTSLDYKVAGLIAGSLGGKVLQVVQGSLNTGVANNTFSEVDTGLSATITPLSTSSKILVLVYHGGVAKETGNAGSSCVLEVYRGATRIVVDQTNGYTGTDSTNMMSWSASYLDSPNTTSATTYKTMFYNFVNAAGVSICRSLGAGFQYAYIQLVEIAG